MTSASSVDLAHRRFNPLTGESILVSPQRSLRPWRGQESPVASDVRPAYDPACPLCPGNLKAGQVHNPRYAETFVFPNDFPALLNDAAHTPVSDDPFLRVEAVLGECRVMCFSPRHGQSLAEMATDSILQVIDVWIAQVEALSRRYRWVQIFENKGEMMGCSDPHPHGQIWATDTVPIEVRKEDRNQRAYLEEHGSAMLADYLHRELQSGERVVIEDDHWAAVLPFWAVWPFETLLLPRRAVQRLPDLANAQREGLARILKRLLLQYDNLFEAPFPYSMGWHGAPRDDSPADHWVLHAHFFPPLLRSATVRMFMVGYEMLAEPQRDLTPEVAAERLRNVSELDYRQRQGAVG